MPWWIRTFWDWFWYYRKGKIKYRVLDFGDTYCASAHSGKISVWNCYGSTPEQAIEVAKYRMKQALTGRIAGIKCDKMIKNHKLFYSEKCRKINKGKKLS